MTEALAQEVCLNQNSTVNTFTLIFCMMLPRAFAPFNFKQLPNRPLDHLVLYRLPDEPFTPLNLLPFPSLKCQRPTVFKSAENSLTLSEVFLISKAVLSIFEILNSSKKP